MYKKIVLGSLAALGLVFVTGGQALARTDAETEAIVMKFNKDAFDGGDKAALPAETAPDFIEHHPTGATATPERDRAQFLARFGVARKGPGGAGGPPPPALILVSGNYVLLMTKMDRPDPTAPGKTYEADWFDLFRVNDSGQVAEHWDSGTVMPMPRGAGTPPG